MIVTTSRVFYLFGKLGWGVVALNESSARCDDFRVGAGRPNPKWTSYECYWSLMILDVRNVFVGGRRAMVVDHSRSVWYPNCAVLSQFQSILSLFSSYSLCRTLATARDLILRHFRSNPSHKLPSSMK